MTCLGASTEVLGVMHFLRLPGRHGNCVCGFCAIARHLRLMAIRNTAVFARQGGSSKR